MPTVARCAAMWLRRTEKRYDHRAPDWPRQAGETLAGQRMVLHDRIELSTSPFNPTSAFAAPRGFVVWIIPSP
jgi:hypothetical protein